MKEIVQETRRHVERLLVYRSEMLTPARVNDRSPETIKQPQEGFPRGGARRDSKSPPEQVPNRWLMQIRRRRIAQMLKNGRLKICESVPLAIGETRPRNTRNKPFARDVSTVFRSPACPLPPHLSFGSSEAFPFERHPVLLVYSNIYFSFTYVYF